MPNDWGRIAIGVRISKHPEFDFFQSWTALLTGGVRRGDTVLQPVGYMPAHAAATEVARRFMAGNCDTLLYVDDDMTFGRDALMRLRENPDGFEYDMLSALATTRSLPPKPILLRRKDPQPDDGSLHGEWFDRVLDFTPGKIVPVDATGLAFTLVRRSLFERIWPGLLAADNPLSLDDWFPFCYGPGNESDDIPFCRRARAVGGKIGVDTGLDIGHCLTIGVGYKDYLAWFKGQEVVTLDAPLPPEEVVKPVATLPVVTGA